MDKDVNKNKDSDCPSVEEYINMDDREKDIAIQKAVLHLQTRIREILYLMETEMKKKSDSRGKEVKKDEKNKG